MDPSPPYSTFTPLQEEESDLATAIRQLSNKTINIDEEFQSVYSALKTEEMGESDIEPRSKRWAQIRKVYADLLWAIRNTAAQLRTRTTELTGVILPILADAAVDKQAKLSELQRFHNQLAPSLLNSKHATEQMVQLQEQLESFLEECSRGIQAEIKQCQEKIDQSQKNSKPPKGSGNVAKKILRALDPPSNSTDDNAHYKDCIENWKNLSVTLSNHIHEICTGLKSIPPQIESLFLSLWNHEENYIETLQRLLCVSAEGIVADEYLAGDTYEPVNAALKYFETNLTQSGPPA